MPGTSANIIWVPCGSVQLALHDFGGSGDTLIIAHANGFPAMCYEPLARRLKDRFHCYGLDMRGQGDGPPNCDQPFLRYRDDLITTVRYLRATGCYFFGHSGGGLTGIMAEGAEPGLFKCLYVYEPPIYNPDTQHLGGIPYEQGLEALVAICRKRRRSFPSREDAARSFAAKPPMSLFHSEALRAYVDHALLPLPDGSVELKCSPEVELEVYQAVPGVMHDIYRRWRGLECPVTLAMGQDFGANEFVGQQLRKVALLPAHSHLELYKTLQHLGPFEDPDFVVARMLNSFEAASNLSTWASMPRDVVFESARL